MECCFRRINVFYILFTMEVCMAAKFEMYLDKKKEYRFRLKAANGQVIATGEGYKSKDACVNGIESVKKNAPVAEISEVLE